MDSLDWETLSPVSGSLPMLTTARTHFFPSTMPSGLKDVENVLVAPPTILTLTLWVLRRIAGEMLLGSMASQSIVRMPLASFAPMFLTLTVPFLRDALVTVARRSVT